MKIRSLLTTFLPVHAKIKCAEWDKMLIAGRQLKVSSFGYVEHNVVWPGHIIAYL